MNAKTFPKTILIGRLGKDPRERDEKMAEFPIGHTILSNGKETIEWHRIVVFGKQKDIVMKYLKKGDLCCIEGRLEPESYDSRLANQTSAVVAERITFLSNRRKENEKSR